MRKSRFSEAQIAEILKEGESGVPINDLIRKHGISRPTYFNWRAKYAGVAVGAQTNEVSGVRKRQVETDVCGSGAGEHRDRGCSKPKTVEPSAKRQAAEILVKEHGVSIARACILVKLSADGLVPTTGIEHGARSVGDRCGE
jgi:putative transposase